MKFYWIDDNPDRENASNNLGEALNVTCKFVGVKDKNLEDQIATLLTEEEPDLIIIDHNLQESESGIFKKGSSVAASIRETWPRCPIICVSAVDPKDVDSQQKALYEDIIPDSKISDNYLRIESIALSFKILDDNKPKTIDELLKLIKVPEIDAIKLSAVMPTHDFSDTSLSVWISRWVRKILLRRPGFLYDSLWLSTLIGIKEESFHKVEHLFEPALYKGLFSNEEEKRWWKSTALQILFENSAIHGLPWERGRGLPGIDPQDYSVSYATGEPFPETVAFEDIGSNARKIPLKVRESALHPEYTSLLYFDDLRIMKPAE